MPDKLGRLGEQVGGKTSTNDGAASLSGGGGQDDQTRMTSLGKGSYLWLYFKTRPSTGRSTCSHLWGPNNPEVVYRAFPHDQSAVNCVALGHFGELGMCWLLFLSAFFLMGGI